MMKTTTKPCVTIRLFQSFKQANSVTIFFFILKRKIGSLNLAWKHIRRKTLFGHPRHYGHRLTTHFSHLQMLALGINS